MRCAELTPFRPYIHSSECKFQVFRVEEGNRARAVGIKAKMPGSRPEGRSRRNNNGRRKKTYNTCVKRTSLFRFPNRSRTAHSTCHLLQANAGLVLGLCQLICRISCLLALGAMHDIEAYLPIYAGWWADSLVGWLGTASSLESLCRVKELQVRSCSLTPADNSLLSATSLAGNTFRCPIPWLLTDADGYL